MDVNRLGVETLLDEMTEPLASILRPAIYAQEQFVTEIRLHCDRPIRVYLGKHLYFLCGNTLQTSPDETAYRPSRRELAELLARLSDYSLYAKEDELRQGYLTVCGGHRVGVCTGYLSSGCIDYSAIGSINIRVARSVLGCASEICTLIQEKSCSGVLLAGPPMSGKTTILRDTIRQLSTDPWYKKISLVDERREIAACCGGVASLDVGYTDVLDGFQKQDGIMMSVRALSPDIIACDELASEPDASALLLASRSGIIPIATVHASTVHDINNKPFLQPLFCEGCISHVVLLSSANIGLIEQVIKVVSC